MPSPIQLSQLPAPTVVEKLSFEQILADRKSELIQRYPADQQANIQETLARESEPITEQLEENSYRETVWRNRVNQAAKALLLAFAMGSDLDQQAANFNVERLIVQLPDPDVYPPVPIIWESDDALRARAQRAFDGLSTAGPGNAYVYFALSADGRVADASSTSPSGAVVIVSLLGHDGNGAVDQEVVDIVDTALNAEDTRPVADRLTVQSAEIVNYRIDATLFIYPGPERSVVLAAAQASATAYAQKQRRIGRDIRLSAVYAALSVEGVQDVELVAPAQHLVLDDTQASYCTAIDIMVGGTDV